VLFILDNKDGYKLLTIERLLVLKRHCRRKKACSSSKSNIDIGPVV